MDGDTMTDLLALVERCENAMGPNRELGDEILLACGWYLETIHAEDDGVAVSKMFWVSPSGVRSHERLDPTASINAALTLIPEGWTAWELRSRAALTHFAAELSRLDGRGNENHVHGYGATPALTFSAAALRARAAK